MFELFRAYETAKNEENKFLRNLYIKYTKYKLKKVFFDKFSIEDMKLTKELLMEFIQFDQCANIIQKGKYRLEYTNFKKLVIRFRYNYYFITIKIKYSEFDIEVSDITKTMSIDMSLSEERLNSHFIRELILMMIYNYCVDYIYGKDSDLYIRDKKYMKLLDKLF